MPVRQRTQVQALLFACLREAALATAGDACPLRQRLTAHIPAQRMLF